MSVRKRRFSFVTERPVTMEACEVKVDERAVYKKDYENRTKNLGDSAGTVE